MNRISYDDWCNMSSKKRECFTGIIYWINGTIYHLKDGLYHRLGAPAIIYANGKEEYWVDGVFYNSKLEWLQQTQMFKDLLKFKGMNNK